MSAMPVMAKPWYVTVTLRDGSGHVVPNYYVGIYPQTGVQTYSAMVRTNERGKAIVSVPPEWTSYNSVRVYVNPFSNDFDCSYYEPFALNRQYGGNVRITTCQAAGDSLCLDGCFDLQTDPDNCGSCGTGCSFTNAGSSCDSGMCVFGSCNTGFGNCDHNPGNGCEADLNTNALNCGTCGNACSPDNAAPVCDAGACSYASCNAGFGSCDGNPQNGCETDITTVNDCGTCGNACSFAYAESSCTGGACTLGQCLVGRADCDGAPANGCEQDVMTDPQHCGSCGNVCSVPNAVAACMSGSCDVDYCTTGFGDCDEAPENGCEAVLETDPLNCGDCGNYCARDNVLASSCTSGSCSIDMCADGYEDCDGYASNGCEAELNTDTGNCGSCGNVCSFTQAESSCSSGSCTIESCRTQFGNCDGNDENGCEAYLHTDTQNCGSCGNACAAVANGVPDCSGGSCIIDYCDYGFDDCDYNYSNGCETDLSSIVDCGYCDNVCDGTGGTPSCTVGSCEISCDSGYGDCDGYSSNGCEADLNSETQNCGSCNNVCPADHGTAECNGGSCGITCNSGWGDCNGPSSVGPGLLPAPVLDGCETDLSTDTQNCGDCGKPCAAGQTCSSGTCTGT